MSAKKILVAGGALAACATLAIAQAPSAAGEPEPLSFAGCARQADGKVVLASTVEGQVAGRPLRWIVLERQDENGRLDDSFGSLGRASLQIPDSNATAVALSLSGDGKIVVAGTANRQASTTGPDALVARFLPNGELDRAFAGRGWLVEDLGGNHDRMSGVDADRQGGIFLVGSSLRSYLALMTRYDFATMRIGSNGDPDARFGKGGKAFVRVGSVSEDQGRAVVATPDGGAVLAGLSRHSATPDFTVVRLTATGGRDVRFGTLGWKILRLSEKGSQANAVALQPDGKVVAVGNYMRERKSPGLKAIAVRLAANGAFDGAFAEDGIAELKLADEEPASFERVAMQDDGRILAAGLAIGKDGQRKILVARLLANGKPDLAFGTKGEVRIALDGRNAEVRSLMTQPDGKILVCGQTHAPRQPPQRTGHFVLRLEPDGRTAAPPAARSPS
jgi:uncharacterized delta-60 repeat protein